MDSVPSTHVKRNFFENNPKYREIKAEAESATIGDFHSIDEYDDEIWLLQCAKGTDLRQLCNQRLKLPGRSSFNELEAVAIEKSTTQKAAFGYCTPKGRNALKILPIKGKIVVRERLAGSDAITEENIAELCPSLGRVPMPECIKLRHPLLGAQFDKHLKINKQVEERLKHAEEITTQLDLEFRKSRANRKRGLMKSSKEANKATSLSPQKSPSKKSKQSEKAKSRKSTNSISMDVSEDLQWLQQI